MTAPAGWRRIDLPGGVSFAIPPDARRGAGTSIDSAAGWFEGNGYRLTFDFGRFGEPLDRFAKEEGVELRSREVAGRAAAEVAFVPTDEPFAWARVVQVDFGGGRTFTVRVSCESPGGCGLIEAVAASITTA